MIEHFERRLREEHRAAGAKIGTAHAVDRLVRAGGDDHPLGSDAAAAGERGLERRSVGIAAQRFRVEGRQRFEQGGRGQRPLVPVQLQGVHGTIWAKRETTTSVPPPPSLRE